MSNQKFFIHDIAQYKDFEVVIIKCISNNNNWLYEVRPKEYGNTLPELIPQEALYECKRNLPT